jgi:arylsulfatase A-like enzyme
VLLVLDESVRASDVCSVPAPACPEAPFTNVLLPRRFGFAQMRAVDSTTALSLAALLSGLSPSERRARLLSAPMLPEFAYAAKMDAAFWTAQNLLFANTGRFLDGLPLSAFASGTELAPYATYETGADDGKLLDRALSDLTRLREPFLAVAQLSNTHFPYVVDTTDLPFSSTSDWRRMDRFGQARIRYRDAIHRQDKILAAFLGALRATEVGRRTVVVFLSDHGEQIGERGRIGHTWGVYDEELRVPMWIDAPVGTLADDEAASLRALAETPLTMLDVAPTVLDLLGLWEDPAIAPWRARMTGASLLRGGPPPRRAVIVTNCSEIYSCEARNWGAMRATRKVVANEDDRGPWRCFDIADDPGETHDLGPAACGDLPALAEADGRGTPY